MLPDEASDGPRAPGADPRPAHAPATRTELLDLLTVAAELEHSLACQYLFAAYTLKADVSEGLTEEQLTHVESWERMLLMVARQEMEHLGLVGNLATALGGTLWLGRPRFPYATHLYGHTMALERFSESALKKFVCFERPEDIRPEDAFCREPPKGGPERYRTVGELYELIRTRLVEFAAAGSDPFIGPSGDDVLGTQLGTDFPRLGAMGGGYDVFLLPVTDLTSALAALDLIVEQGEGNPSDDDPSHYRRFLQVLDDLRRLQAEGPPFDPARNVVSNPGTVVTNPAARAVMRLLDDAYRVMLLMLTRLFAHTDESAAELQVLRSVAFFPLMTMAIRPLAEVLTELPAHESDDGTRAGPSFDTGGPVEFLPHRGVAWTVLAEALAELAAGASRAAAMPAMPERLHYIARSLLLVSRRFDADARA
jgi:ferritin-like protein